ncbi:MFS transporter [Paracoccus siganidrum]|uniref:MFS transporter n=1 Tax=Paracoccus siganidrum TaxID=1276757 RepID=A0A418ZYH0_9RHOB|nr:MFS transporter [Paracoccus siganidrum]RJL05546.1 MFS transporter [Paracoccus siganidrum]RMC37159.1 MFS transporter [Paracoccus siganidrum]
MNRKRIWGWWFFDWASQPYHTLLLTFVFSIYFAEVAKRHFIALGDSSTLAGANAQALWGYGLAVSGAVIAVLAPVLGAIADTSGRRMPWIWLFSGLYVLGAAGLWFLMPDQPALIQAVTLFGIGLIGVEFATIFTNALLPGLAPRDEIGRLSGSGYAFGYLGGVAALAMMLLLFQETPGGKTLLGLDPLFGLDAAQREGTRFVGPFVAIWYVVFMIPFFLWVKEPRGPRRPIRLGVAMRDLWLLIRSLRHRRSLASWLVSSMFSRDALNGLYGFGGVYAGTVLGWPVFLAGIFGVVSAISAAVISWIGGRSDRRWGPKPVIIACTLMLIGVCTVVVGMDRDAIFGIPVPDQPLLATLYLPDLVFFGCGILIGGAGGALQAASRTMMVRHTTEERATEGFGLYALSGKATAFLAPFTIALVTDLTGSQRIGISPLIVMFLLALVLLIWVKAEGEAGQ